MLMGPHPIETEEVYCRNPQDALLCSRFVCACVGWGRQNCANTFGKCQCFECSTR